MISATLSLVMCATTWAGPFDSHAVELRYSGTLNKSARTGDGASVKRLNLYAVVSPAQEGSRQLVFVVEERGGGTWPWAERFGSLELDGEFNAKGTLLPRVLYEHEGTPTSISLPVPVFAQPGKLMQGAKWNQGREAWEVVRQTKVQDRTCWQVAASTNFGHRRTLWIDVESPLLVQSEERIFIGQGEEHTLKLQLDSVKPLEAELFARIAKPQASLIKLQSELARSGTETKPELTESQLKAAADAVPALEKDADETPFRDLVAAISKDVKAQLARVGEVAKLGEKFVGQAAPPLVLKQLNGQPFDAAALKGKIVVLHFWEYQGEPILEPYGQVGYLDFLHGKRRKLGVEAIGVAVDSRLADAATAPAALRSVLKFKSFMNVGYPLTTDDGSLLSKLGDPRRVGAKLPLWVVIAPDGKIAGYHVGYYNVNPDEGLKDLDEALVKLIRENKSNE